MRNALGVDLDSYFEQFRDNMRDRVKEKGTGLREYVDVETGFRGEAARPVGFVDAPPARRNDDPAGETPIMGHSISDRWVYPIEWEWGDLITRRETIESMSDPTSKIFKAAMKSMARFEKFEVLIPSFFATAKWGKRGEKSAAFNASVYNKATTPDGRAIDVDLGGANAGMNTDKLKKIFEIFYNLDVLLDDMEEDGAIFVGCSAVQNTEMIAFAEINADKHIEKPVIKNGKVMSWMGLTFVHSNNWPKVGNVRQLPVWMKDGMYHAIWEDLDGWMRPNTNRKGNPHIYMHSRGGSTRIDELKVLQLQAYEA